MARRKRKRRARRAAPLWMLLALALLVAGFLTRRMLVPRALHYLGYRPPGEASGTPSSLPAPAAESSVALKPTAAPVPSVSNPDAAGNAARDENAPARPPAGRTSERITERDRRALEAVLRGKSK
jgi:hypothetical protein